MENLKNLLIENENFFKFEEETNKKIYNYIIDLKSKEKSKIKRLEEIEKFIQDLFIDFEIFVKFIAPIKDTKNYVLFIQNNYNTFDNHFIIQDLKTLITE